jgi:polyferredoxin
MTSLSMRHVFMVDVTRDRGVMARISNEGNIENVYQLEVSNTTEQPETYLITISGLPNLTIASSNKVSVNATDERRFPISLQLPSDITTSGSHPIQFVVEALSNHERVSEKSVFYVPK